MLSLMSSELGSNLKPQMWESTGCIPNCRFRKVKNFKDFPKDVNSKQTWIKSLGLSSLTLHVSSTVCEDHFEISSVKQNIKTDNTYGKKKKTGGCNE